MDVENGMEQTKSLTPIEEIPMNICFSNPDTCAQIIVSPAAGNPWKPADAGQQARLQPGRYYGIGSP